MARPFSFVAIIELRSDFAKRGVQVVVQTVVLYITQVDWRGRV